VLTFARLYGFDKLNRRAWCKDGQRTARRAAHSPMPPKIVCYDALLMKTCPSKIEGNYRQLVEKVA